MFRDSIDIYYDVLSSRNSGESNVGGICDKIRLIRVDCLESIVKGNSVKLPVGFAILKKAFWVDIAFTYNSGKYVEFLTKGENGEFWTQQVSFEMSRNDDEKTNWLYKNIEVGFVGFITDHNDNAYMIGDIETPLFFSQDSFDAGIRAGKNKRDFVFSTLSEHPAYLLSNRADSLYIENFRNEIWLTSPHKIFSKKFNNQFR